MEYRRKLNVCDLRTRLWHDKQCCHHYWTGRRRRAGAATCFDQPRRQSSPSFGGLYRGTDTVVGRKAKAQLNQLGRGVFGDIVRSPKIYLGSPVGLNVGGVNRPAMDVVADV